MDYLPPERPALIAQAREEERRSVYDFVIDFGQIDRMREFGDFTGPSGFDMDILRRRGLVPGQYVELGHADDPASKLTFYLQEHKPCSVPTYEAFRSLLKLNPFRPSQPWLTTEQLGSLSEILGDKLNKSKFEINANVNEIGGRKVLSLTTISKQKPAMLLSALFVVADSKNRVIEEIGYKDVRKDDKYWRDNASYMLTSIKFIKEKTNDTEKKKPGTRGTPGEQ